MLEHVNTGIPGKNSSASYTPGAGYSVQGKGVTMRFETSDGKKENCSGTRICWLLQAERAVR